MLKNSGIKKTLVAMVEIICDEANRNPNFAMRLEGLLTVGKAPTSRKVRKEAIPDPFQFLAENGKEKFLSWLSGLSINTLRSMVRAHRLDSSRLSDKWRTSKRFITLIVERVEARTKQGDVFRNYVVHHSQGIKPQEGQGL